MSWHGKLRALVEISCACCLDFEHVLAGTRPAHFFRSIGWAKVKRSDGNLWVCPRCLKSLRDKELRDKQIQAALEPFRGRTIAEVAELTLRNARRPMSAMQIARAAIASGWKHDENGARSRVAAIFTKDAKSESPRFRRIGRGNFALAEWLTPEGA